MKDFQKLIEKCLEEVVVAGIQPGNITEWTINRRAKRRWGQCTKKANGEYRIQIAAQLLEDERISEKACKDTIIHEILHSCPDGMGHTGKWKEYAKTINEKYGYNIKRTTSGEEKGVENYHSIRRLQLKFMFRCKYCGNTITKKKKCKFTHYYKNYSCMQCGRAHAYQKYILK